MSDPLDIATRHGLPDEFLVLARLYPRRVWRDHPDFSDLAAFWLDRHLMFREVLSRMQSATQMHMARAQPRFGPEIARYTGFFLDQLHAHHTIEDQHLFPQMIPLDARLTRAFDMLDRDHHALSAQIDALATTTNQVLDQIRQGQFGEAGPLGDVQAQFKTFLNRHLEDEEEVIVPLLLKYTPDLG